MACVALPVPPLPLMVSKTVQDEAGFVMPDAQVCSSHDFLAGLQNAMCTLATKKQNKERQYLQIRLNADLMDRIDAWKEAENTAAAAAGAASEEASHAQLPLPPHSRMLPPIEWTYEVVCDFTRRFIAS